MKLTSQCFSQDSARLGYRIGPDRACSGLASLFEARLGSESGLSSRLGDRLGSSMLGSISSARPRSRLCSSLGVWLTAHPGPGLEVIGLGPSRLGSGISGSVELKDLFATRLNLARIGPRLGSSQLKPRIDSGLGSGLGTRCSDRHLDSGISSALCSASFKALINVSRGSDRGSPQYGLKPDSPRIALKLGSPRLASDWFEA